MTRRGPMRDVELVDDDEDGPPSDDAPDLPPPPAGPRARRRAPFVIGAALLAVLVAAGVVGQVVVDRRERAVVAAVAAHPGGVGLLTGPPRALWELTTVGRTQLADVRAAGGLLVGVEHSTTGPVVVRAVGVTTGAEVWRTELIDGSTRPDAGDRASRWNRSGWCMPAGTREDHVVCLVHDGVEVTTDTGSSTLPPSTTRVVVLDTRGSVVTDVGAALGPDVEPTSFAALGDVVVVATLGDGDAELVAVAPDGTVAWRTTVAVPAAPDEPHQVYVYVDAVGDLIGLRTPTQYHLLDAQGHTVRTEGTNTFAYVDHGSPDLRLVTYDEGPTGYDGEPLGRTTVVRADGDVTVDGALVHLWMDDGSVPGVFLTTDGTRLVAWDEGGRELWSRTTSGTSWSALLVDGRVHLDAGTSLVTVDARTGAELWSSDVTAELPVTDGRHLLTLAAGPRRGETAELVALDPATGEEMWRAPLPDGTSELTASHGMLVAVRNLEDGLAQRLTVLG